MTNNNTQHLSKILITTLTILLLTGFSAAMSGGSADNLDVSSGTQTQQVTFTLEASTDYQGDGSGTSTTTYDVTGADGSLTLTDTSATLVSATDGNSNDLSGAITVTDPDSTTVQVDLDEGGTNVQTGQTITVTVSAEVDASSATVADGVSYTVDSDGGSISDSASTETTASFDITNSNNPSYSATSTPEDITVQSSTVTQDLASTGSIDVDVANEGQNGVSLYVDLSPLTTNSVDISGASVGTVSVTNGAVVSKNVDTSKNELVLTVDTDANQNSFSVTSLPLTGLDTSGATAVSSQSYDLGFSSESYSADSTSNFAIQAGTPANVQLTSNPADETVTADGTSKITYTATVEDTAGNALDGVSVQADASSGSNIDINGNGATTTSSTDSNGEVAFDVTSTDSQSDVSISFTEQTNSNSASGSATFEPGATDHLEITTTPGASTAGSESGEFVVTRYDANNNPVTSGSLTVDLSTDSSGQNAEFRDSSGDSLSGTVSIADSSSTASFYYYDEEAGDYSLTADAADIVSDSVTHTVSSANADSVSVTQDVTESQTAGQAIDQSGSDPAVEVTDPYGNLVDSVDVTATLQGGSGSLTDGSTKTVSTTSGTAAFSNLVTEQADTGYNLQFSIDSNDGNVASSDSVPTSTFEVEPASASKLAFTQQPTDTTAGSYISPAVEVTVQDEFSNTVTGFSNDVSVSVNTGTGSLSGTTTVSPTDGVATFDSLNLTAADTYDLTTSATGVSDATSSQFSVTAAATDEVTISPSSDLIVKSGETKSFSATALDQFDNTVTSTDSDFTWKPSSELDGSGSFSTSTTGTYEVNATYGGVTSNSVKVTVDGNKPNVNVSVSDGDGNGIVKDGDTVDVAVNVSDDTTSVSTISGDASAFVSSGTPLTLSEDSESVSDYTGTFDVGTPSSDGEKDVSVTVTDEAGNEKVVNSALTVDNTAPTFSVSVEHEGTLTAGDTFNVSATSVSDATSGLKSEDPITVDLKGVSVEESSRVLTETDGEYNKTFTVTEGSTDGDITFSVTAEDKAGNSKTNDAAATSVDNNIPQVTLDSATAQSGGDIQISWTLDSTSDGDSFDLWRKAEGEDKFSEVATGQTSPYTDSDTTDSTQYTYKVEVTDGAGNTANSSTVSATADSEAPKVEKVETLDTEPNGNIDTYRVTYSEEVQGVDTNDIDSTTISGVSQEGAVVNYTLDSETTGTAATPDVSFVTTEVQDLAGNNLATSSKQAVDSANPVVDLNEGMNLVSFPISDNSDLSVSEVLDESKTNKVWKYDAVSDSWKAWTPEKVSNEGFSFSVEAGQGYIVDADESYKATPEIDELGATDSTPTGQFELGDGWNLVGHFKEAPQTVTSGGSITSDGALGQIQTSAIKEVRTDADTNIGSDAKFNSGEAYWVRMKSIPGGYPIEYLAN